MTFENWRRGRGLQYDEVLDIEYFDRENKTPKAKMKLEPLPSWRLLAAIFSCLKEEDGRTSKTIAEELGVSTVAVTKHLRLAQWARHYPPVKLNKRRWLLEAS